MILWLASYPKAGNTLLRSILTALIYTEDGGVDFNKLLHIENYPPFRYLEKFTNKFNNIAEVYKVSLELQKHINRNKTLKIFKTHSSNCVINGNPFTNKQNTIGAIYVVRDPRDVLISSSSYFNTSFEEAKNIMFRKKTIITNVENHKPIHTLVGSWSDNYNSWVKNNKNVLLIKYEDLVSNKEHEVFRIINFINTFKKFHPDEKKIKNAIKSSSFESMSNMEKKGLFKESSKDNRGENITFFRSGKAGSWKEKSINNMILKNIIKDVEKIFYNEMKELGYFN